MCSCIQWAQYMLCGNIWLRYKKSPSSLILITVRINTDINIYIPPDKFSLWFFLCGQTWFAVVSVTELKLLAATYYLDRSECLSMKLTTAVKETQWVINNQHVQMISIKYMSVHLYILIIFRGYVQGKGYVCLLVYLCIYYFVFIVDIKATEDLVDPRNTAHEVGILPGWDMSPLQ